MKLLFLKHHNWKDKKSTRITVKILEYIYFISRSTDDRNTLVEGIIHKNNSV